MYVVNLGERHDPRWYPAEKLEILAYQKYKSLPPSHLMDAMHGVACKTPSASMALVRDEGLATLGVTNFNNAFSPFVSVPSVKQAIGLEHDTDIDTAILQSIQLATSLAADRRQSIE